MKYPPRRIFAAIALVLALASAGLATADDDSLNARKAKFQQSLESQKFNFPRAQANLLYRLSQFEGDCEIGMIYDPSHPFGLKFKLIHSGKEVATIDGTIDSAFCGEKGVFYFAQPALVDCGCHVTAFDSKTGAKLWDRELAAVGLVEHFSYKNQVIMTVSPPQGFDSKEKPSLTITGNESYGDYVEVLDAQTGTQLAHKVYREGF